MRIDFERNVAAGVRQAGLSLWATNQHTLLRTVTEK